MPEVTQIGQGRVRSKSQAESRTCAPDPCLPLLSVRSPVLFTVSLLQLRASPRIPGGRQIRQMVKELNIY